MYKNPDKDIILADPAAYFHDVVVGAISEQGIEVSEHVTSYLVNLLSHYIVSENLFPQNADGKIESEALAMRLSEALQEESIEARRALYRQLGDFSLYIAGFFSDSLQRKLVDIDYYIDMGGAAYLEVARIPRKSNDQELFEELAGKFPTLVGVLSHVSDESNIHAEDDRSLLRVYELWEKTGNQRLAKHLAKAGIIPDWRRKKRSH